MARIRSIHPGFFTDEAIVQASPQAQVFLIGLWTQCDDQGVFEWKPVTLKMRILPAANCDADGLLSELASLQIIQRVEVGGVKYGLVRNFRRWQRPKKPNSTHPLPVEFRTYVGLNDASSKPPPPQDDTGSEPVGNQFGTGGEIDEQMEEEGGRRKEEGEETTESETTLVGGASAPTAKRKTKLPADWQPTPEQLEYAKRQGCADPADTAERFRLHHLSKGTTGADWNLGFQYWCRNEKTFRRGATDTGKKPLRFN